MELCLLLFLVLRESLKNECKSKKWKARKNNFCIWLWKNNHRCGLEKFLLVVKVCIKIFA